MKTAFIFSRGLTASVAFTQADMAAYTWVIRFKTLFLLSILSTLISSCALYDLKKEITKYETTYGLVGEVIDYSSYKGSVIVVLYSEKDGQKNIVEYTLPEDTGHFSFIVNRGTYYLAAFEDLNGDYVYDENEPVGYFGAPERIVVPSDSKAIVNLEIRLSSSNRFPPDFPTNVGSEEFKGTSYAKFGNIRGNCSLMMANNDGTVEIASELDYRAQMDAEKIFGYDADYGSILTSPIAIDQFNKILASQEPVWRPRTLGDFTPNAR